jgi:hypothetical protein
VTLLNCILLIDGTAVAKRAMARLSVVQSHSVLTWPLQGVQTTQGVAGLSVLGHHNLMRPKLYHLNKVTT